MGKGKLVVVATGLSHPLAAVAKSIVLESRWLWKPDEEADGDEEFGAAGIGEVMDLEVFAEWKSLSARR